MKKLNVAVVGCGNISGIYLKNLTTAFEHINVYAVSDLKIENAERASREYGISKIMTLDEILEDKNIDIVLNLTTPHSHYGICKQILESGKHVYVEKPLSLSFKEGKELIDYAEKQGLYVGCAPDTFMGAGLATCKKAIDDGLIGEIVGATAFMVCHGHESWHPSPEFYYEKGGGPMFDMGPYYLAALTEMLGNVKSVMGMTAVGSPTRTITSQPKFGKEIAVEVPTHVNGLLRFQSGAIANIITSFDVWSSRLPNLEIHGTKGALFCPDPNMFGGEVKLYVAGGDAEILPYVNEYSENSRGIGLADMASAIIEGRENFAASGRRALHVLEIMEKIHISSDNGEALEIETEF